MVYIYNTSLISSIEVSDQSHTVIEIQFEKRNLIFIIYAIYRSTNNNEKKVYC